MHQRDSQDFLPFPLSASQTPRQGSASCPLEAVLLDFNGVLHDDSAWHHWFHQLLRQVGVGATCDPLATFHSDYLPADSECEVAYWQSMRPFLAAIGLTRSLSDEVIASGKAKRRQFAANARPLPGVPSTLSRMDALRVPLGVACSRGTASASINAQLHRIGIRNRFRIVTSLPLATPRKSVTASFESVSHALNAPLAHTAFVSACPLALLGARAQGMLTIAFNAPHQAIADYHLPQFQHLTQLLACEPPRLLAG